MTIIGGNGLKPHYISVTSPLKFVKGDYLSAHKTEPLCGITFPNKVETQRQTRGILTISSMLLPRSALLS